MGDLLVDVGLVACYLVMVFTTIGYLQLGFYNQVAPDGA